MGNSQTVSESTTNERIDMHRFTQITSTGINEHDAESADSLLL